MASDEFYARKFGLKKLTILEDRYCGTYSGGEYTAWPCDSEDIPSGPSDSDVPCAEFWSDADEHFTIGRGKTRNAAVADLARKLFAPKKVDSKESI